MNNIKNVTVKYNGEIVGYLAEIEEYRYGFQYDSKWIRNGFSISPFSLPLSNKVYISNSTNFDGLYGVFWDSLPDGWGSLLFRRCMRTKGIDPDDVTPLTKLCLIGKNGLGGLNYEPFMPLEDDLNTFDLDQLSIEIDKILNDDDTADLDSLYGLGGSSGGARPKAHMKIDGEDWIIKFPCAIDPKDIGIKEYKLNILAKKCGIDVSESKLFESSICKGYFGTKRFDRINGKRKHVISLSSILETTYRIPNLDYYHLFQVTQNICDSSEQMYEAFKRMSFNVIFGNKDDHGKNFAFIYCDEKKTYELSPFYDITETKDKIEHEMTVNGNGNPDILDLMDVSKHFGLSDERCKLIIENMLQLKREMTKSMHEIER